MDAYLHPCVLGRRPGSASIKRVGRSLGRAVVHSVAADDPDDAEIWTNKDRVVHAYIIATMAGAEAERELIGVCLIGGDEQDVVDIDALAIQHLSWPLRTDEHGKRYYDAEPWPQLKDRLRRMARMLVRRHQAAIKELARALLAKEYVRARDVERIVRSHQR